MAQEVMKVPKYISNEKRADIIFHKQSGKENAVIAEFMRVCVRSVERVWSDFEKYGKSEAKVKNCGRKSSISLEQKIKIIEEIEQNSDITLNELIDKFELKITESGLSKYLKALGLSFKKRQPTQQTKTVQMSNKSVGSGWTT
jgi:transposase